MRITSTLPDHGAIVEAVLEGFVQAAQVLIASGAVPAYPQDTNVRYAPEATGSEEWLLPHQVLSRGVGDCEDLALWAAAGYRATGDDPEARAVLVQTGPRRMHCVVEHGDGTHEDVAMALALNSRGYSVGAASQPRVPTLRIRDNRTGGSGPSPFAGLPPAAAPSDGGTPTVNPFGLLEASMAANGQRDITIRATPGAKYGSRQWADLYGAIPGAGSAAGSSVGPVGTRDAKYGSRGPQRAATQGFDPTTGLALPGVFINPFGQPVDKDGAPLAPAPDPYNPYGNPYDPYGSGQYPGMYGLYDPYGQYSQDPFYRGPFPTGQPDYPYGGWQSPDYPYGGWQSEGQPMLTYEDVYGQWDGLDETLPGPLPPQYGPLPGDAYGEEGYSDE